MQPIKLITLDLDGTLLRNDKSLSERNRAALAAASEKGVWIVPTTGRYFGAMPEAVRNLPFLRYVITVNGGRVEDRQTGAVLYKAEIPPQKAVEVMRFFDTLPAIYDAYIENAGFMTRDMFEHATRYVQDEHYANMVFKFREPVDELKSYVLQRGAGVQKTQLLTHDAAVRQTALTELPKRVSGLSVCSSFAGNVEVNDENATKGKALLALAKHLGIPREQTMAFGDGLNDVSMLSSAGVGVAMENGFAEAKAAADLVTCTNEEDGVAAVIERYVL